MRLRGGFPVGVALLLVYAVSASAFTAQVEQAAGEISARLQQVGHQRVAVVDFTDLEGDSNRVGRLLADELSVALLAVDPGIQVVDRKKVDRLIEEIGFTAKGLTDPSTAQELGRMLGAEALVFGTVTSLGDSVRMTVKALGVESTRWLAATGVTLPMTSELRVLFTGRAAGGGPGQPFYTETYGDLEYRVYPCQRNRKRITCEMEILAWRRGLSFQLFSTTRALDDTGREHELWYLSANQGRQGSGSVRADLVEGIPLRLKLLFEGVSPQVTSVALDLKSDPVSTQITGIPVVN